MYKRTPNTSKLTKAFIESKISQEAIVSKYLNIPMEVVQDCINHGHLIKSVFRDDDYNKSISDISALINDTIEMESINYGE